MQFVICLIIPIIIAVIMPIVLAVIHKRNRRKEAEMHRSEFVMKASKQYCVMMIVFTVLWAVASVIMNLVVGVTIWINVILWCCEIVLVFGCIQGFRQKLKVSNAYLTYTPILGKTRSADIKNIDRIVKLYYSHGLIKYKIYVNKKRFCTFSHIAVGADLLLDKMQKAGVTIINNE